MRPGYGNLQVWFDESGANMADRARYPENDPRIHTGHLHEMLGGVVQHAREDLGKVDDPKAQALYETTAEVCLGLMKALEDYESKEPAWR